MSDPFSFEPDDKIFKSRDSRLYTMYHDVKTPPQMDTLNPQNSDLFKWGFSLVALWSSQLSSADTTTLDISPAGIGNIANLPTEFKDYPDFYTNDAIGVQGPGHTLNPYTGQPYATQKVKRGDYARVVAEFWADGPDSETPPGHWFTLLNYVYDHPLTTRNVEGVAPMNNKTQVGNIWLLTHGGSYARCSNFYVGTKRIL